MVLNETRHVLDSAKRDLDLAISTLNDLTKVDIAPIVKSSIILMTYNMIEGVFYSLLQELFDTLRDGSKDIKDLPEVLTLRILDYYCKTKVKDGKNLMKFRETEKIEIPLFSEYIEKIPIFNGNLDSKKIMDISGKFGVSFEECFPSLLYIKNVRNKLAHGEVRFSEACRDKTIAEITEDVGITYKYMLKLIGNFEIVYKNKIDLNNTE